MLKFKRNFKLNPVQYPLGKFNYLYNLATNHFHLFYAPCPKNFVHFFYQWGELPIFPLSLSNISVCSIHLSLSLIFFMKLDHTTFFFFHHSHCSFCSVEKKCRNIFAFSHTHTHSHATLNIKRTYVFKHFFDFCYFLQFFCFWFFNFYIFFLFFFIF